MFATSTTCKSTTRRYIQDITDKIRAGTMGQPGSTLDVPSPINYKTIGSSYTSVVACAFISHTCFNNSRDQ